MKSLIKQENRGCENPAFGKPWFCLSDTRHFRHLYRFRGSGTKTLLFVCSMQTCHFRSFRQDPLFSAGGKTTVSQNHRKRHIHMNILLRLALGRPRVCPRHKPCFSLGLGQTRLSLGQTQVFSLFYTVEAQFVPGTNPVRPWDKPWV